MKLSETKKSFILHWGEMGSNWGISRVSAQVHALLLVSEKALNAQDICEALNIARSNISTALRDLQAWKIVKLTHTIGDRREYYEADKDVWNLLAQVAEKRLEREIVPTIALLKDLQANNDISPNLKNLFQEFITVFEGSISFFSKIKKFPTNIIRRFLKFDKKLAQILNKQA